MARSLTALIAAGGLVGGYAVATKARREAGGAVVAVAGAVCFQQWRKDAGTARAAALTGAYLGAFGASHPLAKRLGAWPSVFSVAGAVGAAAMALGGRKAR